MNSTVKSCTNEENEAEAGFPCYNMVTYELLIRTKVRQQG